MDKNPLLWKGLAVGIILLFVGVTIAPTINAQDNSKSILIDSIPIIVLEYKSDGTVERTVVRMTREQADNYHEEMRNAQDLDTRLSIYKKYHLISQDITVDSLRAGMEERAQKMGLTQDGLMSQFRSNRSLRLRVYRNIFCSVSGSDATWDGFCFPPMLDGYGVRHLGLFFFITGGVFFYIGTKGLLGEFYLDECLFVKLVGFVGIIEIGLGHHNPFERWIDCDGFCVYVKALVVQD